MIEFTAGAVAAEEEQEILVVTLAEHSDGDGIHLMLQRALSFDDQDVELGLATYCLCTETGATCYGGVVRWQIDERVLEIVLDDRASTTLDADGGFRIWIPAGTSELVGRTLRMILAET